MGTFVGRSIAIAVTFALLSVSAEAQSPLEDLGVLTLPTSQVPPGRVAARFMGTSTILLDDGTTQILIDGFFTRPSFFQLAGPIASNPRLVEQAMTRAGIGKRLRAVLVAHSHYDHVLDAPAIAAKTGARLVGSSSTANVGRGAGLPDSQIDIVADGQELDYGAFHVTVFRSIHSPNMLAKGEITRPLTPPAFAGKYREGGSYSFLIQHGRRSILIHPSANFVPKLYSPTRKRNYRFTRAEVVFLGIGTLGNQDDEFIRKYFGWVVTVTDAHLVIPIHWDDFTRPLGEGLQLPSRSLDDVASAIERLRPLTNSRKAPLKAMPLFEPVDIQAALNP